MDRKKLQDQAIKLLKRQSSEKLQELVTIMQSGVKIYSPYLLSDLVCNVQTELVSPHEDLGPGCCNTWIEDVKYTSDSPTNFYLNYVEPKKTILFSDYLLKHAEKYVPHPDYVLCDNSTVLMQGKGKFVYEGYIFYSSYNGSVSTIYVSKEDQKANQNRFVVGTSSLLKIVHKDDVETLIRERMIRYKQWEDEDSD